MPSGFAEDDGFAGAMDARGSARKTVSGGLGVGRGVVPGDEPDLDLRAGADCARAGAVGAETFSGGSGRARIEGKVSKRDLFYGCGEGGRSAARGDSAVAIFLKVFRPVVVEGDF